MPTQPDNVTPMKKGRPKNESGNGPVLHHRLPADIYEMLVELSAYDERPLTQMLTLLSKRAIISEYKRVFTDNADPEKGRK